MEIKKEALVGTLESGDALIRIIPSNDFNLTVESSVAKQFEEDIKVTIKNILTKLDIKNINIDVNDKGALDCVLQARVKAAIVRATDENIAWENLL